MNEIVEDKRLKGSPKEVIRFCERRRGYTFAIAQQALIEKAAWKVGYLGMRAELNVQQERLHAR
jgi:hypothetical protein